MYECGHGLWRDIVKLSLINQGKVSNSVRAYILRSVTDRKIRDGRADGDAAVRYPPSDSFPSVRTRSKARRTSAPRAYVISRRNHIRACHVLRHMPNLLSDARFT